ncbi:bis(5'-adenosyl)-triphosphatase isoform X1 [Pelmatolapia mariae]|uniref:bis(5'-adenosyl)-triphosphatase isoform X1 n=1 Tax=Pelmatolapia mariae TaxID=158779 RepID=UPI002FE51DE6
MEAKLRVIIDDQIEKLVLPSGIPPTVEELQSVVKDTFEISNNFSLQYFDPEFQDYFTLHRTDQIKDKDTVKVVGITPVILSLTPVDDSFGSPSGQLSDYDSSYAESVVSSADSAATTSSQDTIILKRQKTTERCEPWPKQFPIPQFAYETEMYLERATEEYKKNGNLLPTSKVKTDILEKLAETIFTFTAYPSSAQVSYVAEALVTKYPCLKEPGSFSGYYGWQQSIKYKMANYRTKLRGFGVPELTCNAMKHKSPGDQKSANKVKKPRKAEVNYLPPYPAGEDEDSQEEERIQLLTEVKKRDNNKVIKEKMAKTFAHRRHEIVNLSPSIEDIKARWPALFEASHLQDEFYRITLVHLEPKFMSMLDEYTPKLLALFHSKGGAMGLKLQAIIAKSPSNPSNNITRNLVIQCLMVYLGESIDQLIKEYSDADEDGVSQDLSEQSMKIYKIKAVGSEEGDIGIVLEGVRVMPALGNFPRAYAMLVGLTYAVDLAYPKELKYTLEVFQKLFLELDCARLSPKVNSLKNKLLA